MQKQLTILYTDLNINLVFGGIRIGKNRGDDQRDGSVKGRKQVFNSKIGKWVKIDTTTGKIIGVKKDGEPYKGVRGKGKA